MGHSTAGGTHISWEFACSFCLSHTNSLYLRLTLDTFLVKHTLSVWNTAGVTKVTVDYRKYPNISIQQFTHV